MRSPTASPVFGRAIADQYSNVNFASGNPNPNVGLVEVGADGRFCYDGAEVAHDVIIDQLGVIDPSVVATTETFDAAISRRTSPAPSRIQRS